MKIKSLIYTSLASVLLFASCDINKEMQFDDETQAFIAFESARATVMEAVDGQEQILAIPLHCASVKGIDATVTYEAVAPDTTMNIENVQGVKFNFVDKDGNVIDKANQKISFNADNRFATIYIKTINDNENLGDVTFNVQLANPTSCNLGANNAFIVTISDDEDPINRLVGSYVATGYSLAYEADVEWPATITRDEEIANRIWFGNIIDSSGFGVTWHEVFGTVDVELNTITIRRGQSIYGSSEDETSNIILATYGQTIQEGGTFTINYTLGDVITITMGSNYLSPYRPYDQALFDAVGNIVYTK